MCLAVYIVCVALTASVVSDGIAEDGCLSDGVFYPLGADISIGDLQWLV